MECDAAPWGTPSQAGSLVTPGRGSGAVCCSEAPLSRKAVCLCASCCWARLPAAVASAQEEVGRGRVHPVGEARAGPSVGSGTTRSCFHVLDPSVPLG